MSLRLSSFLSFANTTDLTFFLSSFDQLPRGGGLVCHVTYLALGSLFTLVSSTLGISVSRCSLGFIPFGSGLLSLSLSLLV